MDRKINILPDSFWLSEYELLFRVLFPIFSVTIARAAKLSYDDLAGVAQIGVSWDVVNSMAERWAQQHTAAVVSSVSKTSMAGFLAEFEKWQESGEPLSALVNSLKPYYGEARASMVAVTETTRCYALGNLAAWQATGMVEGFNVVIAEDELVCPICSEKNAGGPYRMDEDAPPYHVNCRCAIRPVLK